MADGRLPDVETLTLAGVNPAQASSTPDAATPTASGAFSSEAPSPGAHLPNTQSLDAFLESIAARAFRFAELGLRHREDALDVVQEAMLRMLQYRERPNTEWTPLFWSILRSRMVDLQRRGLFRMRWLSSSTSRDEDGQMQIDWRDESTPDPSRTHDGREAYTALAAALRGLPRRQREAFTLRILEECDVATTARIMGCGEGAVKTHLSRAREALRQQLDDFR